MKYSVLLAALVAAMIAGCNKEGPSAYSSSPASGTKPQSSAAPKTEPPKAEAPASAQPPAVAATSPTESKPAESGGTNLPGGEAKPTEGAAAPAGAQPVKKETK